MERWCIVFSWSSFDSRLSSCSSWMTVGMQRSTCSPGRESMLEQVDAWEETVTLWEAKIGGGSWQDLQTQGERSPGWTRFPDRTCHSLGDACWSRLSWRTEHYGRVTRIAAVHGELLPMGWAYTGEVHGQLSPVGGIPHWSRGKTLLPGQQQEQWP